MSYAVQGRKGSDEPAIEPAITKATLSPSLVAPPVAPLRPIPPSGVSLKAKPIDSQA